MRKKNTLTKRQFDVINDLFAGGFDEQAVLKKHNISPRLYDKWQSEDVFIEHLERRIAAAYRQSSVTIAAYAPIAAAKLVNLTDAEHPETARKACCDIISMQASAVARSKPQAPALGTPDLPQNLTPENAAKILEILAEESRPVENHCRP